MFGAHAHVLATGGGGINNTENRMLGMLKKVVGDQRGVTALEYALIAALVAVVIIGGVSLLGTNVSKVFSTVANTI
jgi:pilus assembly protein Flp/PilA